MDVLTIDDAARLLAARELSSRELVEGCLRRADELDPLLGTFVTRGDEAALAAADEADRLFAAGEVRSPLQGVPLGIKDVLTTADLPTTGQSRALPAAWAPARDAASVARLREAAGVLVGKTTTMELAFGCPTRPRASRCRATRGRPSAGRAARARAPRTASPPGCSSAGSAPTRAAASGSRRRSAASPG